MIHIQRNAIRPRSESQVHVGDVVCMGSACGEVAACVLQGFVLSIIVLPFVAHREGDWERSVDRYELWPTVDVSCALAWQNVGHKVVVVRV